MMDFANLNPIDVQTFLKGIHFPASKDDIIKLAQENNADQEIFAILTKLPEREYPSVAEISKELRKIV